MLEETEMALDITELYNVSSGVIREAAKAAPTTRIEDYKENFVNSSIKYKYYLRYTHFMNI